MNTKIHLLCKIIHQNPFFITTQRDIYWPVENRILLKVTSVVHVTGFSENGYFMALYFQYAVIWTQFSPISIHCHFLTNACISLKLWRHIDYCLVFLTMYRYLGKETFFISKKKILSTKVNQPKWQFFLSFKSEKKFKKIFLIIFLIVWRYVSKDITFLYI